MSNVLSDTKREQVLALGQLGWSLREIERKTGVRRETISGYLTAAEIAIRPERGRKLTLPNPASSEITDSGEPNPASSRITDSNRLKDSSRSICAPYQDFIEERRRLGRNAMAVYQDLVDRFGFRGRYHCVRRFIRTLEGTSQVEARAVIQTAPGEEGQVDYGEGPWVRHPQTGKYRRPRLFVFTLGYSRKSVRLLIWKSSSKGWAELHERAFRRLGGVPRVIVHDNLREGVLKPDVYDSTLNPLYRDVLKHYGVIALPCRVRDPDRKGKVEAGVGHAQKTPLKGLKFETLEEAQAYLDGWEERWADTRIHGTTKRQVKAMFEEERPCLLPLPVEPFRYYQFGEQVVHLDGHLEVEKAYYSVPPGHIGQRLPVQWNELYLRILDSRTGQLLREHIKQTPGHRRTRREDLPSRVPLSTQQLLLRAARAGPHIGALSAEIHSRESEAGIRRILGVLSLSKKHGPLVVDNACQLALEAGAPSYRFVRRYLERHPAVPLGLKQVDPLIRELTHYRDFIQQLTQSGEKP